jgi:hypothetical protein
MSIPQVMSTTVANYPFTTGIVILGSSAIIYINNNEYIQQKAMSCAWTSMRIVSRLQIWYNDMFSNCCGLWYSSDIANRTLYIIAEGKAVKSETVSTDMTTTYNKNYDLVIFKYPDPEHQDKSVYKRYQEIPDTLTETPPLKGLFFTANIKYGGKTYEIDAINSLTVPNTRLFDRSYMQWYMQLFHGIEIFDDNYNVELLDNDMNTVEFDHTKFINITSDNYEMSDAVPTTHTVWRCILNEDDIPDSLPENKKITLADISSPPLTGKRSINQERAGSPVSLVSNNTDVSFDIVDSSEAN